MNESVNQWTCIACSEANKWLPNLTHVDDVAESYIKDQMQRFFYMLK